MLIKQLYTKLTKSAALTAAIFAVGGCSMVHEDLPECPARLSVRFTYDYNISFADAFRHEVKSVSVWAFDASGALAWSGSASGAALDTDNFVMDTPLGEGTYDFVAWGGLLDNADFTLQNYTPASREELEVRLKTIQEGDLNISKSDLAGLYNGRVLNYKYHIDPQKPSLQTVTVPLMKDTKDMRIMLQHLDGSPIVDQDFTVSITYADSWYAWNNAIVPGCPTVTYRPWNVKYGQTTAPGSDGNRATTTVASLLFELSTARLMADANAILTIHRNRDDQDIVNINLTEFLLMVRGHYDIADDQEYLDRQDDYSIVFFLDANSSWYVAQGIYINGWVVVPPQQENV